MQCCVVLNDPVSERARGEMRCGGVFVFTDKTSSIIMAAEAKLSFFTWRYCHYFTFVEQKGKNVALLLQLIRQ